MILYQKLIDNGFYGRFVLTLLYRISTANDRTSGSL